MWFSNSRSTSSTRFTSLYSSMCSSSESILSTSKRLFLFFLSFNLHSLLSDLYIYLVLVYDGFYRRMYYLSIRYFHSFLFSSVNIWCCVWVTRFFPDKQYNYIKRRLQLMKRDTDFNSQPPEYVKDWYREFIFGYLEPDGIFMLRLLSSNTSDFVCTEVN